MIDTGFAPLEESLKPMLVDIVRSCQSIVAQNYGRIRQSGAVDSDALQVESSPPTILRSPTEDVTANGILTSCEPLGMPEKPMQLTDHTPSLFFREPPFLGAEAEAIDLGLKVSFPSISGSDDSGYDSLFSHSQDSHGYEEPSNKDCSGFWELTEEDDVRQQGQSNLY